jgi:hypothetical protein
MTTYANIRPFGGLAAGALLSVLLPAGVYVLTLAPTVTFEDSGQLITAAATLGISHPSGYPVFALVGQLFTLLPFGSWAWRVNLASAAAAAAACGVFYLLLRRLFRAADAEAGVSASVAAAAAAVALGFGFTFWSQAVVAEAYAVNALVLVATLACVLNFASTREARWGYLAAFLGGLALAAHTSSVVVTVPAVVYLVIRFRKLPSVRGLFLAGALAAWGFSIYLYLPLRAAQGPAINWGDPRTLPTLYRHFTRRMYGGADAARPAVGPSGHVVAYRRPRLDVSPRRAFTVAPDYRNKCVVYTLFYMGRGLRRFSALRTRAARPAGGPPGRLRRGRRGRRASPGAPFPV